MKYQFLHLPLLLTEQKKLPASKELIQKLVSSFSFSFIVFSFKPFKTKMV